MISITILTVFSPIMHSHDGNSTSVFGFIDIGNPNRDDYGRFPVFGSTILFCSFEISKVLEGRPGDTVLQGDDMRLGVRSPFWKDTDTFSQSQS